MKNFRLGLIACAFVGSLVFRAEVAGAIETHDAVADFSDAVNTETSTWSYRYTQGQDFVHDGVYPLLIYNTVGQFGYPLWAPDAPVWGKVLIPYNYASWVPGVGGNNSGAPRQLVWPAPTFAWPTGTVWMHPPSDGFVVVSWLAPHAGTIGVAFRFDDMDSSGGNGINWYVEHRSALSGINATLAQGTVANGQRPGPLNVPGGAVVQQGDRIQFVVSSNGGEGYDSTEFTATISYVLPAYACVGFEPPLDGGPVAVKKNRALPFRATLVDESGNPVTGADIDAPPVIQVVYNSATGPEPVDPSEVLPVGLATDGNQFVFTTDGKWQYNLKTSNFTAPGSYTVTMQPGNSYLLTPDCTGAFVVK